MTHQDDNRTACIPEHLAGHRLDQALAQMFPEYSRSRLKAWIQDGLVTVDGASLRPRDAVAAGAMVELQPQTEPVIDSTPEPMALDLAYEDADVLIVKKPAGLVVHPGAGNHRGTLMNGLLHHAPALEQLPRAGIVHRLDKETSGLLLVAKTLPAHTALVRQLADREIQRHYVAVCNGVLTGGGKIDAAIRRHPVDRKKQQVAENGRSAITHYRVKERFAAHTYVDVKLETGRTHQIRVHFAYRRHPLVGDPVYGGRLAIPSGATSQLAQALRTFRRQALHARELSFAHPVSGVDVTVQQDLPDDLQQLLDALRGRP